MICILHFGRNNPNSEATGATAFKLWIFHIYIRKMLIWMSDENLRKNWLGKKNFMQTICARESMFFLLFHFVCNNLATTDQRKKEKTQSVLRFCRYSNNAFCFLLSFRYWLFLHLLCFGFCFTSCLFYLVPFQFTFVLELFNKHMQNNKLTIDKSRRFYATLNCIRNE